MEQRATLSFGGGPSSCSTRSLAYSFGTAPTVANAAAPSQLKAHAYSSGAAPKLQSAAFFHIVIVFQCPVTGVELEVESRSWSLWLQFAFAFVKTGTSILASDVAGAAESGAAALESLYNAYHEEEGDQKSFDLLLRAPLLLSSEQDELLGGLRREG